MELENVVPWGRSLAEYRSMFDLTDTDLAKRILGCGDGPASFNAELSGQGGRVISVDPVYAFSADAIRTRITEIYPGIVAQMEQHRDDYDWTDIRDPEVLGHIRMATEVRVYPLVSLAGRLSPHVTAVRDALEQAGISTLLQPVSPTGIRSAAACRLPPSSRQVP